MATLARRVVVGKNATMTPRRAPALVLASILSACGGASGAGHAGTTSSAASPTCVVPLDDARARAHAESVARGVEGDDEVAIGAPAGLESGPDLDGDGQPETFVERVSDRGVTGNASYYVYLSGAGCGRYAGWLGGEMFGVLAGSAHHGALDVSFYADGGCAGLAGDGGTYVYDGSAYRTDPAQSYSCACPDEAADPSRDPRCPSTDP